MLKYISLVAGALLLVTSSCQKAETALSREEEMRGGKWRISGGTVEVDPFVGKDTTYTYNNYLGVIKDTCKVDDYLVFLTNYDGEQYPNTFACSAADPDKVQFRWQLFDNDKGIYFLNATETFFREPTVKADFASYAVGRFTIRYTRYDTSLNNNTKFDTTVFTQTFTKY